MLNEYKAGKISIETGGNLIIGYGTRWLTYVDVYDIINIKDVEYKIIQVLEPNKLLIDRLYNAETIHVDDRQTYTIIKTYALNKFSTNNILNTNEIIVGTDQAIFGPNLPNPTNVNISTIAEQSDDNFNTIITDGTLEISCSYVDTITVTLSSYGYEDYTFIVQANENILLSLNTVSIDLKGVGVYEYDYIAIDTDIITSVMYDVDVDVQ